MDKPENQTRTDAPLLDCEHDESCPVLTCDFCLNELPSHGAIKEEGEDYVAHFCGLDCFEAWRRRNGQVPGGNQAKN